MNPSTIAAAVRRAVGRGSRGTAPRRPARLRDTSRWPAWGGRAPGWAALASVVVAVVVTLATATGIAATGAAWTDRAFASAPVSAGSWPAYGSCTAMTAQDAPVGTCAITDMRYDGRGGTNKHTRDYSLTFTVSAPAATSYITVSTDLSTATVGTDSSVGPWNWTTAVTGSGTQFTPTSACAALPLLTGRTIAGWDWSGSPEVSLSLADSRSAQTGRPTCS